MPTPTGLPIKGDRFRHMESGVIITIVARGQLSRVEYNVIAQCEGYVIHFMHPPGYPDDHILIANFGWMLSRSIFQLEKS